jgi:hypothetical protein
LESSERINVAITRAKRHLFLVSNLKAFFQIEIWSTIIRTANTPPSLILKIQPPLGENWNPPFQHVESVI